MTTVGRSTKATMWSSGRWWMCPDRSAINGTPLYPWANDFVLLDGETNSTLVSTNVDSFDDEGWFGVLVTTATGESLFLDPVQLEVDPVEIIIPPSGAASRYPAEIVVFGQTTNFTRVEVILKYLDHQRSEDLDILLVSPSGHQIMLMSDAGGTNAVEDAF